MPETNERYNHSEIEPRAQALWEKLGVFRTRDDPAAPEDRRLYCLDMFPYPSGEGLHVGHVEGYTATDIYARYLRLRGVGVLHPMGWDAFGLPAENAAIKQQTHPRALVEKNVARFAEQLKRLGFSYDWSRAVNTTDPEYYRWTQWIFLKLFHLGLAYEAVVPIHWCPSCKTGLANEEVIDGKCERCGTVVTKKDLRQWMLRITKYADRLLRDLDQLDWPEGIKELQRNWIGRSEGTTVTFRVTDGRGKREEGTGPTIDVFTTRADTLFGATYMVLAPEHPLVEKIVTPDRRTEVLQYIEAARRKSDLERSALEKEKTGVDTGAKAINPVNGEAIPIWVADYILVSYGTGAIMAVPAHDERDFAFATKYGLPIRYVVAPERIDKTNPPQPGVPTVARRTVHALVRDPQTGKFLCLKWKEHPWTTFVLGGAEPGEDLVVAARREIVEETGHTNLRFVRTLGCPVCARYFAAHKGENREAEATAVLFELGGQERGEVSPDERSKHEVVWKSREEIERGPFNCSELDVWLKYLDGAGASIEGGILTQSGEFSGLSSVEAQEKITAWLEAKGLGKWSVQYKLRDWVFSRQRYWGEPVPIVHCAQCGVVPVPEEQLPVLLPEVERYEPTGTGESPLAAVPEWVNTTCPRCAGGAKRETNTMPQWAGSCWYFLRFCDPHNAEEPWSWSAVDHWMPVSLYVGGAEHAVLHLLYARFWMKALYDGGYVPMEEPFQRLRNQGTVLGPDGQKMSKSRGNVVSPDEIVAQYGADTLRLYEMFLGPLEASKPWDPKSVPGVHRFLKRVWRLGNAIKNDSSHASSETVRRALHKLVKKVGADIEALKFNTAIAAMMEFLNLVEGEGIAREDLRTFLVVLGPFAPHIAEELWQKLERTGNKEQGTGTTVTTRPWPTYDPKLIEEGSVTVVVQVNGRVRATITVPRDLQEAEVRAAAEENENVRKWIVGSLVARVIVVPNRLVNFVVR